MPAQTDRLHFKAVKSTNANRNGDSSWGPSEVDLILSGPDYGDAYNWLSISNEVAKRLHNALGAYLAKEAHSGGEG